ncbi:MAG: nitroreductase/quinone reductase family protein [Anaerolineales bacterium]
MLYHLGATNFGVWTIKHLVSPFQRYIYRISQGRALSSIGSGKDVLLLTTKGRRTGKERTIPVFYIREGEQIVICNVRPKSEHTNPWVINLRSHPVARLQIGPDAAQYQARQATGDEVNHLWPRLIKLWPAFKVHYENGGHRSIFVLEKLAL